MAETIEKLVFVFDLDETLVGGEGGTVNNPAMIKLLRLCINAREKARVDAILLLTNTGYDVDTEPAPTYIQRKVTQLESELQSEPGTLFNNIYDRAYKMVGEEGNKSQVFSIEARRENNRHKGLLEVKNMLEESGKNSEKLNTRVYFFDDSKQAMMDEIDDTHAIRVPEFNGLEEESNAVDALLTEKGIYSLFETGGGYRKKRKTRGLRKFKKKKTKRMSCYKNIYYG